MSELADLWLLHGLYTTALRLGERFGDFAPGEREVLGAARDQVTERIVELETAVLHA